VIKIYLYFISVYIFFLTYKDMER